MAYYDRDLNVPAEITSLKLETTIDDITITIQYAIEALQGNNVTMRIPFPPGNGANHPGANTY